MQQMNLFEATYEKPNFPSHVKLIELFAGIGAQFKSLKALGVDVESHRTCEWSWQSIIAYNAIHHNGEIADTSHMTYQEVLDFIEGVSHDYNKPMTRKNLERRGEEWCRRIAGAMITNHNFCPDVSKLHGKDLDIRERERETSSSSHIPSHARIYPTRDAKKVTKKAPGREAGFFGRSRESSSN